MSTKKIYIYKIVLQEEKTKQVVPTSHFKEILAEIMKKHGKDRSLQISEDTQPIMLDILEDNDNYLFVRLSKKKLNNNMQKRDYQSFHISDVLDQYESARSGVEMFTYCILGYRHGILSIVKSTGAPSENAFSVMLAHYNRDYLWDTQAIPNPALIGELINGRHPEINRVEIEVARPDPQALDNLFKFDERKTLDLFGGNVAKVVVDLKPQLRGTLSSDKESIRQFIDILQRSKNKYNKVIISGKRDRGDRQRQYDIYEEYFKYPIDVKEYVIRGGKKVERNKEALLNDYKTKMIEVYDCYHELIWMVADRT